MIAAQRTTTATAPFVPALPHRDLPVCPIWRLSCRRLQHVLDKTTPHKMYRWIGFAAFLSLYVLRVYSTGGFYIVTYGLGIYLLNLFIGFITPPVRTGGQCSCRPPRRRTGAGPRVKLLSHSGARLSSPLPSPYCRAAD